MSIPPSTSNINSQQRKQREDDDFNGSHSQSPKHHVDATDQQRVQYGITNQLLCGFYDKRKRYNSVVKNLIELKNKMETGDFYTCHQSGTSHQVESMTTTKISSHFEKEYKSLEDLVTKVDALYQQVARFEGENFSWELCTLQLTCTNLLEQTEYFKYQDGPQSEIGKEKIISIVLQIEEDLRRKVQKILRESTLRSTAD